MVKVFRKLEQLTWDEWIELGKSANNIRNLLMAESEVYYPSAARRTPLAKARVRKLKKALKGIDVIKDVLDDIIFEKFPEKDTNLLTRVFYGVQDK